MKATQDKIYYIMASTPEAAMTSPFMEPFRSANAPPVLILVNNIDEFSF